MLGVSVEEVLDGRGDHAHDNLGVHGILDLVTGDDDGGGVLWCGDSDGYSRVVVVRRWLWCRTSLRI